MRKHHLAFVDVETTGLDPDRHEIIEIGCLLARQSPKRGGGVDLEEIDNLEIKVKPEHLELAEPEALRINGYNDADWLFAASLDQAMRTFADKTDGAIMVAQNLTFDWSFLQSAFVKTGVKNRMHFPKMDLISIAYAKLYNDERVQRFGLKALCEHFNIINEREHTALADARAAFEIYKKLFAH